MCIRDRSQPKAEVIASDLDAMVEKLREQRKEYQAVERPAKSDDQVTIDFKGTKDGEAFDGGAGEDHQLILGSGSMIPGFEDGIVGMTVGEEKTLSLTFPEQYHAEALAGADVEFVVSLKGSPKRPCQRSTTNSLSYSTLKKVVKRRSELKSKRTWRRNSKAPSIIA